ncbi:MAG: hypothetical protein KF752_02435 [Pirellulaceae bacterium]|nr:hypothetical protein [Pirellulaceae bacterium]
MPNPPARLGLLTGSAVLGWGAGWMLVAGLWITPWANAQENRNAFNLLLRSTSRQALVQMQRECNLWMDQPLRIAVASISQQYGICIWIDRRIDPGQLVSLSSADQSATLGQQLDRLAQSTGAAGGLIENVYLIAPADCLARMQRAAVVLHGQLASKGQTTSNRSQPLEWPALTSSNELLRIILNNWNVESAVELPHDLFHAGQLPACSLATQISLLLGGFDLQAMLDREFGDDRQSDNRAYRSGVALRLKTQALDTVTQWQDWYQVTLSQPKVEHLHGQFPGEVLQRSPDGRWRVQGQTNLHWQVLASGLPPPERAGSSKPQRYSLEIQEPVPVEVVLGNLAKNFGWQLRWSDDCSVAQRNRLVQLKVENVTSQQLLEHVCQQAGLACSLKDHSASIRPAKSDSGVLNSPQ